MDAEVGVFFVFSAWHFVDCVCANERTRKFDDEVSLSPFAQLFVRPVAS